MSFVLSKVLWMLISPGNGLLLLLLLGTYLALSSRQSLQKFGSRVCFVIALIFFGLAILPVDEWIASPLENQFPAVRLTDVDGIILLGGDENPRLSEARQQPLMSLSASRYIKFAELARRYPQAQLIFTGGPGWLQGDAPGKDANIARQTLSNLGILTSSVVFEDHSRNTHENAFLTAALVHPTSDQHWLLVTSAWHMPRAIACFRKAGFDVYPAPSDYISSGQPIPGVEINLPEHLHKISIAFHEYCGLLAYHLMGYTDTIWPH